MAAGRTDTQIQGGVSSVGKTAMGIELILLKSMFILAAIGFAVQQIVSVNRELKRDREAAAEPSRAKDEAPAALDEAA